MKETKIEFLNFVKDYTEVLYLSRPLLFNNVIRLQIKRIYANGKHQDRIYSTSKKQVKKMIKALKKLIKD